ncbi:MAG: hypothetical protein FH756_01675 [Firmicutes bacterium]|nr:hypothetical protein [Bacillota bacterium]
MPNSSRLVVVDEWTGKHVINEAYRPIAQALVERYPELGHIAVKDILFVDDMESTGKHKDKYKFAQISKVPEKWHQIIYQMTGKSFGFMMEFFKRNIESTSREQVIALVYHELRHIDIDGELKSHDIEDWANMHYKLGFNWAETKRRIPNLLDDEFNWDEITGPRLFDDQFLRVIK